MSSPRLPPTEKLARRRRRRPSSHTCSAAASQPRCSPRSGRPAAPRSCGPCTSRAASPSSASPCPRPEARRPTTRQRASRVRRSCTSIVKVPPGQRPGQAPVPPQGACGGSGRRGTPRKRPVVTAESPTLVRQHAERAALLVPQLAALASWDGPRHAHAHRTPIARSPHSLTPKTLRVRVPALRVRPPASQARRLDGHGLARAGRALARGGSVVAS